MRDWSRINAGMHKFMDDLGRVNNTLLVVITFLCLVLAFRGRLWEMKMLVVSWVCLMYCWCSREAPAQTPTKTIAADRENDW